MDFHFIWSKLTGLNAAIKLNFIDTEAVARRCSVKKVFLKISQISQENTSGTLVFSCEFSQISQISQENTSGSLVFSCEFSEISRNVFSQRKLLL